MADIQMNSALHGFSNFLQDPPTRIKDTAVPSSETVRDHINFLEQRKNFRKRRIGTSDVHHQRQASSIAHLASQLQSLQIICVGEVSRHPDLNSQDYVTIPFDRLESELRIHVAQIQQLSVLVFKRMAGQADD